MTTINHCLLSVVFSCLLGGGLTAQTVLLDGDAPAYDRIGVEVSVGYAYNVWQNGVFSPLVYEGSDLRFGGGYRKRTPDVEWLIYYYRTTPSLTGGPDERATLEVKHFEFGFSHVRRYGRLLGADLHLGGEFQVYNADHEYGAAGNNSSLTYYGTRLNFNTQLRYTINRRQPLRLRFDVGLFQSQNEPESFGYSESQRRLEDGEFGYEIPLEEASPITGFWNSQYVRAGIGYQFGRHFNLDYTWNYSRFPLVRGYSTHRASHALLLGFTL